MQSAFWPGSTRGHVMSSVNTRILKSICRYCDICGLLMPPLV